MDTDSFIYDIPMSESQVFAVMKENEDKLISLNIPKIIFVILKRTQRYV